LLLILRIGIVFLMQIALTPLAGETEPHDPAHAGEWAGALEGADYGNPPWCFYFARVGEQPAGVGLFKGPPADGVVEIAYLVFLGSRRRGLATAIVSELVSIARWHGMTRVVAHTLPENNPSTRVLAANGFMGPTEVVDPEDGPVWRWELAL
jgi:RimJ/RimL family protein N-acetyltransferase